MSKRKQIPTLEVPSLDKFHFGNVEWQFSNKHHIFHINRLENAVHMLQFPIPPHRKTVYDLVFLTKGESTRSKGMNGYTFSKNQIFFLPALQLTTHDSMSKDVNGFFLHFAPSLFANNLPLLEFFPFLHFNTPPVVTIPDDQITPILNIFHRLLEIYSNNEPSEMIVWYLMALFSEVNQYAEAIVLPTKNTASILTQQYKASLTQHIYTYHTVKEYAQLLYVTPNHLNKCVKSTLNQTAQSLLNEMLVMEAKSLLKYSNLNISEIADRLCGSNPSNFSRFFKKETGYTPRDYINS